jgi:hypothetical protein
MHSISTRRLATAIGAAGIALAALTIGSAPQALAAPGDGGCSSMAMPAGTADADAVNPMTRAGQINAANNPPAGPQAPMTCQPAASHG